MLDAVHRIATATDRPGDNIGLAGYARRANQTNVRRFNPLPVRPVARRLDTPATAARRNPTFSIDPSRIVAGQKSCGNIGLLSSDAKAKAQLYQNNFQSYGLFKRDVLIENPLVTMPVPALKAGGPPVWRASRHVSSSEMDGLENFLTANTRIAADARGVCRETNFMNGAGMPGHNGNIHGFRFVSVASQR